MVTVDLDRYYHIVRNFPALRRVGKVTQVIGLVIEVSGIRSFVGEVCLVERGEKDPIPAEVVGFKGERAFLMPLSELHGISPGSEVVPTGRPFSFCVGPGLLGRVVNGLGQPLEGTELSPEGMIDYLIDNHPPNPLKRHSIERVLPTGIKAIDGLITCGEGQRLGIFSGSGVGKSTLLGMIARYSEADVNVIALIGERGREVGDFLQNDLGKEGLARSVIVAATSDRPALERVKGALLASAIAEYFRDCGYKVILMMDSVTRFAMAQREIGLAVGEPPATKGYTPSVFAMLPRLLERAGNVEGGSITGFYSVLVDGDDFTEPIVDAVRSILDGHVVLSRELASKNHFPAIDILESISRLMPYITDEEHRSVAGQVRDLLAAYREAEDLINIGAYVSGTNPRIDEALKWRDAIVHFLRQDINESFSWKDITIMLQELMQEV